MSVIESLSIYNVTVALKGLSNTYCFEMEYYIRIFSMEQPFGIKNEEEKVKGTVPISWLPRNTGTGGSFCERMSELLI